jgi:predicted dehydrogenase
MARYLLGEFATVKATTETFVKVRPVGSGPATMGQVDVDDAAWVHAEMGGGARGTLFVTRFATGAVDDMNVQVYGERAAFKFSLQDGNVLQWFDALAPDDRQGWTRIATGSRYAGAAVPPPRSILGWNRTHTENIYQFVRSIVTGSPFSPDARDGAAVNQVTDACYASADDGQVVQVS